MDNKSDESQDRYIERVAERFRRYTGREIDKHDPYLEILQLFSLCTEEVLVRFRTMTQKESREVSGKLFFQGLVTGVILTSVLLLFFRYFFL